MRRVILYNFLILTIYFISHSFCAEKVLDMEWYEIGNESGKGVYLSMKNKVDGQEYKNYQSDNPYFFAKLFKMCNILHSKLNNWYHKSDLIWCVTYTKPVIEVENNKILSINSIVDNNQQVVISRTIPPGAFGIGTTLGEDGREIFVGYERKKTIEYVQYIYLKFGQNGYYLYQNNSQIFHQYATDMLDSIQQNLINNSKQKSDTRYFAFIKEGAENTYRVTANGNTIKTIRRYFDESYPALAKEKGVIIPHLWTIEANNIVAFPGWNNVDITKDTDENFVEMTAIDRDNQRDTYLDFSFQVDYAGYYPIQICHYRWGQVGYGGIGRVLVNGGEEIGAINCYGPDDHYIKDFFRIYLDPGPNYIRIKFYDNNCGAYIRIRYINIGY